MIRIKGNIRRTIRKDFHYCPPVKAWQKQGCSDKEIAEMCDHAMCGDRSIGSCFGVELDLPQTIARAEIHAG